MEELSKKTKLTTLQKIRELTKQRHLEDLRKKLPPSWQKKEEPEQDSPKDTNFS